MRSRTTRTKPQPFHFVVGIWPEATNRKTKPLKFNAHCISKSIKGWREHGYNYGMSLIWSHLYQSASSLCL